MPAKKRILSISYDESLLTTRKMLLEGAGFDVVAAYGFSEAATICRFDHGFDLIIMGHSIPQKDKSALLEMLKPHCLAPLLSIRRHNDPPLPEAQFSLDSYDGPQALIEKVKAILADKPMRASSSVSSSAAESQGTP